MINETTDWRINRKIWSKIFLFSSQLFLVFISKNDSVTNLFAWPLKHICLHVSIIYVLTYSFFLKKKKKKLKIRFLEKKKKILWKTKRIERSTNNVQLKHSFCRFSNLINLKIPFQIKSNPLPFYFPCPPLEKGKQTDNTLKNTLFAHCSLRLDSYFVYISRVYVWRSVHTRVWKLDRGNLDSRRRNENCGSFLNRNKARF